MRHKNLDLILAMLIAALNVGWALLPNRPIIGVILVLPLVFILPGYTLTAILSHKRSYEAAATSLLLKPKLIIERPLDTSDRLILSFGLSLAIDILSGFILNMFPIGLQALSWAVFLGLLTSVFALLATYLRHKAREGRGQVPRFHITIYECILLVLAITVMILSVQYSAASAAQQPRPGFTQLWMIQSNQAKNTCVVRLGVRSFESTSVTYRVTLTVNGNRVNAWSVVTLAPRQEWDQQVPLKTGTTEYLYVEAQLYRVDKPGIVYRDVHMTLHRSKCVN